MTNKKNYIFYIVAAALIAVGLGFVFSDEAAKFTYARLKLAPVALWLNRGDAVLSVTIGNYYFNGGAYNIDYALRAYQKALSINPQARLAHYQIARINFIKGDLFRALEEINIELELHPDNLRSFYVRGLIYGYLGQFGRAEDDFSSFIEFAPDEWAGHNDLAWVQAKQGKFKEAKNTIRLAFGRLPGEKTRNPWLWTSLGVAHLNLQEYNEAKDAFLTARGITEKMSPEYFWSAYPGNNPRDAGENFSQFIASLYFNLGLAYKNLGISSEAREAFQNYLTIAPEESHPSNYGLREEVKALLNGL